MINKYSLFFWLFLPGLLGLSGCAQKMAKQDSLPTQATAQPTQPEDPGQDKAAAPDTQAAQDGAAANVPGMAEGKDSAAEHAPPTADKPTAKQTAAATALLPLPPKEIVETINKLTTLPRVRYLSRTAQYDYYVGGRVEAKFDLNKNQLLVTNAPAAGENTVTCEYSKDGAMISGKDSITAEKIKECNKLVNELTTYLTR